MTSFGQVGNTSHGRHMMSYKGRERVKLEAAGNSLTALYHVLP